VAIVSCQQISQQHLNFQAPQKTLAISSVAGYQLQLQEYIPAAFDVID
jgi:putative endonuclease